MKWGQRSAIAISVGIAGSALVVLGAWVSRHHWFFDLLAQFLLPARSLLYAAPILLGILIFRFGAHRLHGVSILAVPLLLIAADPLLRHAPETPPNGAEVISIYQQNIYVENRVIDRIVETVERDDPDIIALVEVRDSMLKLWEYRLLERWPHTVRASNRQDGSARIRLFSRYPIKSAEIRRRAPEPSLLKATVETPLGDLKIVLVHLTRPWPFSPANEQLEEYDALKTILDSEIGPLVILGDFNTVPWGRVGRRFTEDDGFQLANNPSIGTWPGRINIDDWMETAGIPRWISLPIDLAFCRGGIECGNHHVGDNNGSDHRGVQFDVWFSPDTDGEK